MSAITQNKTRPKIPFEKSLAYKYPEVVHMFAPESPLQADEVKPASREKVIFKCSNCPNLRSGEVRGLRHNVCCNACANTNKIRVQAPRRNRYLLPLSVSHPEIAALFTSNNRYSPSQVTASSRKVVEVSCQHCGGIRCVQVKSAVLSPCCHSCAVWKRYWPDFTTFAQAYPDASMLLTLNNALLPDKLSAGCRTTLEYRCLGCGALDSRGSVSLIRHPFCKECLKGTSTGQRELTSFINTLSDEVISNASILTGHQHVDLYLPDLKLAIEYNGRYWHSDNVLHAKTAQSAIGYHTRKVDECARLGVRLVFVWEQNWLSDQDGTEEELRDLLRTGNCSDRLSGRYPTMIFVERYKRPFRFYEPMRRPPLLPSFPWGDSLDVISRLSKPTKEDSLTPPLEFAA